MSTETANGSNELLTEGKYTLVGIDLDTTGRRFIDEIVQLAVYTPESEFSQYIMPYMNLNPAACQRHQIRVVAPGFYRMLKCLQTSKVIKSKTEYAVLYEFLDWIEKKKVDDGSLGVILIYHEKRKFVPYVLLEALKKYQMLNRFAATVKSFVNGYLLSKELLPQSVGHFTLRSVFKELFSNSELIKKQFFDASARVRAEMVYKIVYHLAKKGILEENDVASTKRQMFKIIHKYTSPISNDINELEIQSKNIERQNTFRPIFIQYFKVNLYQRVRAVRFRIILAENGYDYESLKAIWNEKKLEGFTEIINPINALKEYEKKELIEILQYHYDPAKNTLQQKNESRNRARFSNKENVTPRNGEGDKANKKNGHFQFNRKFNRKPGARRFTTYPPTEYLC